MWGQLGGAVSSWVHPRIRGEDATPRVPCQSRQGSPPHTRGRFRRRELLAEAPGFTPAYAGKIPEMNCKFLPKRVHPRIRGEDCPPHLPPRLRLGSPPHTRGRSFRYSAPHPRRGFTPAYAGKIHVDWSVIPRLRVHPRIRGEDLSSASHLRPPTGSPPHTRGRCQIA